MMPVPGFSCSRAMPSVIVFSKAAGIIGAKRPALHAPLNLNQLTPSSVGERLSVRQHVACLTRLLRRRSVMHQPRFSDKRGGKGQSAWAAADRLSLSPQPVPIGAWFSAPAGIGKSRTSVVVNV